MKIYSKANSRWLCSGIQSTWWKWRFLQWRRANACKHTKSVNIYVITSERMTLWIFLHFLRTAPIFCIYVCGGRFDVIVALFPVHIIVCASARSFSFHFIFIFFACVYCEHWLRFETYIKFHSSDLLIVWAFLLYVMIRPGCESTEKLDS